MSILIGFFQNRVLFSAVLGWLLSQVAKMLVTLVFTRKLNFERLWGAGGMLALIPQWCARLPYPWQDFTESIRRHSPLRYVCVCYNV